MPTPSNPQRVVVDVQSIESAGQGNTWENTGSQDIRIELIPLSDSDRSLASDGNRAATHARANDPGNRRVESPMSFSFELPQDDSAGVRIACVLRCAGYNNENSRGQLLPLGTTAGEIRRQISATPGGWSPPPRVVNLQLDVGSGGNCSELFTLVLRMR